jgi:hypothetical protein
MAKVKEYFIETYGVPLYTLGQGGSGGSMQQQQIANAYPGLLDGIMPERLYADQLTFLQPLYDCELLVNVFKQGTWTRDQICGLRQVLGLLRIERHALSARPRRCVQWSGCRDDR